MLRAERVDTFEDDPTPLRALGGVARRLTLGRDVLGPFVEGAEGDALPGAAVVRKVDRDAVKPRPQGVVRFEALERAMGASEGIDHDLLGGRGILRDGHAEPVDTVAIAVEQVVEREQVAGAGRVDEVAIAAGLGLEAVARCPRPAGHGR